MEKKHLAIIKRLSLWRGEISVKSLSGGITNFNYLVEDRKKKYVARFAPKSNILLGLDRAREAKNTGIAHAVGVAPKIVKNFPQYNLLVVEYIEGKIFTPGEGKKPENIRRMARLFKKLHAGKKFTGTFDPFKTIGEYIATVRRRHAWLPADIDRSLAKLNDVKKALQPLRFTFPCHLDLMIENVVDAGKDIKLIDWEYSANSDPRFDLAMFSIKSGFDGRQDDLFLKAYGMKISRPEFAAMKAVVHFREGAWALVQLAVSKIEFDYKKYAMDSLAAFQAIVTK